MNNTLTEIRELAIRGPYDTVVCGGGIAGIAAALAAARNGAKTLLLEREYMLGGLATAGLVTIYLPICDGMGHQVSFGLAEELLRLSIRYGCEDRFPEAWFSSTLSEEIQERRRQERYQVQFNPQLFAIAAEQELIKAGAEILYGTMVSDVITEDDNIGSSSAIASPSKTDAGDVTIDSPADDVQSASGSPRRIKALIVENKTGRFAIDVKSVVDATGDADICRFAGAPTEEFKQGNVLAAWYYSVGKNDGYKLRPVGFCDIPDEEKTEEMKQADRRERFASLTGEELTDQMIKSHEMLLQDVLKHRDTDETFFPVTMGTIPQVRMTRRIAGESTMRTADDRKDVPDRVGLISNWKKRGPVYEVPFSALYSAQVKNLITAGRCISADEPMWDVTRVIPCCAVTGQAAGTAAALSSDFASMDLTALQTSLRAAGVPLKITDIPGLASC